MILKRLATEYDRFKNNRPKHTAQGILFDTA